MSAAARNFRPLFAITALLMLLVAAPARAGFNDWDVATASHDLDRSEDSLSYAYETRDRARAEFDSADARARNLSAELKRRDAEVDDLAGRLRLDETLQDGAWRELDAAHAEADAKHKTARDLNAKYDAARDAVAAAEGVEISKFEATDAFKAAAQKADSARDAFQQA